MELRQLRNFVTLAETLNFHRAAERLHITQPPLTTSIRKLEEEFGVPLFTRTARGVKLTAAGRSALASARRALRVANETRLAALSGAAGEEGMLRLGFIGSATYVLLPRLIPRFRQLYPRVQLQLRESVTANLLADLRSGDLDAALIRVPIPAVDVPDVDVCLLDVDHFVLAVPVKSRLAARSSIRVEDLRDEPFIAYARSAGPLMRGLSMRAFDAAGFQPRVEQEAIQVHTLVSLVESGLGVALVPSMASKYTAHNVRFLEVAGFRDTMRIGIAMAASSIERIPVVVNFRQMAQEAVRGRKGTFVPAIDER
ncbi:LysR family transcriptional regulator [Vineibacter terrae]|uniref:LysR family transcriptional regulator n=1 Tax=Vineibacter terrae TaxID=2586908 RepID=A0A5C8P7W1_9HYPH|nr:LysR family transcriptional regulator [Vineibacter terrae]TXL69324.1 LysR family transcriptional regulator [Vineibacter terrae]